MNIPHEDATIYIQGAIDSFGYFPNPKAIEAIRADVISNYSGHFTTIVLKESVERHANLLIKKPAEPVAQPTVAQNAAAVNAHVTEVIRQLSEEFPDVNFLTSTHNNKILGEFIDSQGGNITMVAMRTGVRLMYNLLEKNPPPPPPPVVPESEPPEVLKILSDGTRQLSMNATDADLRDPSVSKTQLRDWLRRKQTTKVGGRFFNG
jgi:hypothetical protein